MVFAIEIMVHVLVTSLGVALLVQFRTVLALIIVLVLVLAIK